MKRIYIIYFIIVITSFAAFSQNDSINQLLLKVKTTKIDTIKILTLNDLSYLLNSRNSDSSILLSKQALDLALKINYKKGILSAYICIGLSYYHKGSFQISLEYFQKALEISQKLNNKRGIADCLNNIGNIYESQGKYVKALESYQDALKIREEINDKKKISECLNNIGIIHFTQSNFDKALVYYQKSLSLARELNDKNSEYESLSNIGLIYVNQENYDNAIDYFLKAQKICEDLDNQTGIANCLGNIGYVNQTKGNNKLAIEYFQKALKYFEQTENLQGVSNCLNNIASAYYAENNYPYAIEYNLKSLEISKKINSKDDIRLSYQNLYDCNRKLRNFEKALDYYILYKQVNDSIFNVESAKRITEKEMQFEFDKKQKETEIEQIKKDAEQQTKLERQRLITLLFILGFVFTLLLAGAVYRNFRIKKRDNKLLQEKNNEISEKNAILQQQKEEITAQRDEIEEQRDFVMKQGDKIGKQNEKIKEQLKVIFQHKKEITDSIYYAKRIQSAVLPPADLLNSYFPEHFILFKPKDIVSGDFYWFSIMKNEEEIENPDSIVKPKIVIAAADCTGHGVPGAFMSMLGVSFLNELIKNRTFGTAAEILNELRKNMKFVLHQTGKEQEQKDGMDIALCIIDLEKMQAHFAGAYNPLYLLRQNQIIEYKADRMPIGVHHKEREGFSNSEIKLQTGDKLYLFSDGFQDQFGGKQNKKFLSTNFRSLLIEINELAFAQQKDKLNETIENWKGQREQIDDMLVVGIKIG